MEAAFPKTALPRVAGASRITDQKKNLIERIKDCYQNMIFLSNWADNINFIHFLGVNIKASVRAS